MTREELLVERITYITKIALGEELNNMLGIEVDKDFNEAILQASIKAAKVGMKFADEHPRWISVEDELPKENDFILIYGKDGVGVWLYESPNAEEKIIANHITHWMPLPAPPSCSEFPNNHIIDVNKKVDRVIGTPEHIQTALDVLNKKGGKE